MCRTHGKAWSWLGVAPACPFCSQTLEGFPGSGDRSPKTTGSQVAVGLGSSFQPKPCSVVLFLPNQPSLYFSLRASKYLSFSTLFLFYVFSLLHKFLIYLGVKAIWQDRSLCPLHFSLPAAASHQLGPGTQLIILYFFFLNPSVIIIQYYIMTQQFHA